MTDADRSLSLDLRLQLDSAEDLRLLRGALLAARGAELAEIRRRELRWTAGYGTDAARETMTAEAAQRRRRLDLLDRLLAAIEAAASRPPSRASGADGSPR